jgi:hypothetical protein
MPDSQLWTVTSLAFDLHSVCGSSKYLSISTLVNAHLLCIDIIEYAG